MLTGCRQQRSPKVHLEQQTHPRHPCACSTDSARCCDCTGSSLIAEAPVNAVSTFATSKAYSGSGAVHELTRKTNVTDPPRPPLWPLGQTDNAATVSGS
jgi:hypothetical protein